MHSHHWNHIHPHQGWMRVLQGLGAAQFYVSVPFVILKIEIKNTVRPIEALRFKKKTTMGPIEALGPGQPPHLPSLISAAEHHTWITYGKKQSVCKCKMVSRKYPLPPSSVPRKTALTRTGSTQRQWTEPPSLALTYLLAYFRWKRKMHGELIPYKNLSWLCLSMSTLLPPLAFLPAHHDCVWK